MKALRMDYGIYMQPVEQQLKALGQVDGLPISDEELMFLTAYFQSQGLTEELVDYTDLWESECQQFPETPWLIQKGFGQSEIEKNSADLAEFLDVQGKSITIETTDGAVTGIVRTVQFNRYLGRLFVTLATEVETLQFVFSQVPEYKIVSTTTEVKTVTPVVKHSCELLLAANERKPFDDHFRIFTLFSALEYEVSRDKNADYYRIELKYTACEQHLVEQIILHVCKKVKILTPSWSQWLEAELAAMAAMY